MVSLEEPDTGRAWVIAAAACIINMILSGLSRMIGLLYVAVINDYGVTRAEATLPFTIRNAIRCLSGPLVGIAGQRFGIRNVTFWGGVIAATGAALCSIAPSVTWMAVFWGGIHGFGFAFANTLFQVVVNQYFQKYRATASGIALSGACVGSLAFPFIIEESLFTYGLSGSFLILGGIIMHVLPSSLLLSAPQWIEYPETYARLKALQKGGPSVNDVNHAVAVDHDSEESEELSALDQEATRTTSLSNCPTESVDVCREDVWRRSSRQCNPVSEANEVVCIAYKRKDSPESTRKIPIINGHKTDTTPANTVFTISNKVDKPSKISKRPANTQSIGKSLLSIVHLYRNPVYVVISICMSTYILIFLPILTVLVDYSKDKGISESYGKYLINAMAIGDLAGRLGFGWVTDKKLMTIPTFMTLVLLLEGVFICLFPFATSLYSFMILLVLYGMTAGSILVLFPILVLQYVDVREQAVGMASVGFLSGLMSFGIPPMIGHFRDNVGSYDGMFYLTGVISVLSGGLWLLEPVVVKRYYKKKLRKETQNPSTKNGKSDLS